MGWFSGPGEQAVDDGARDYEWAEFNLPPSLVVAGDGKPDAAAPENVAVKSLAEPVKLAD